jgi:hypothetical protein
MAFIITRPLATLKSDAVIRVDALAGKTRLKYVTASPGQEMTYTAKLADAKAYISAGYPLDTTPYIWIATEAAMTGATPAQVADLVVYTAGLWGQVGAAIEGKRQETKRAIAAALTVTDIRFAEQAFIAAMSTL